RVRGQLVEPDQARARIALAPVGPEEAKESIGAQIALGMMIDQLPEQRPLLLDVGAPPRRERLVEECIVRERGLRILARERLPERAGHGLAGDGLHLREHVERADPHVRLSAAQYHGRQRRPGPGVLALLAQRSTLTELDPAGEGIARLVGRLRHVLRGRLVLLGERAQRSEGRLENPARAAVARAPTHAQRRDRDPRELIERVAVPMRVEEHLGTADEQQGRHRRAGAELPLALARRLRGRRVRVLHPRRAPVGSSLVLRPGRQLRFSGDQVRGGHVRAELTREDGLQDLFHAGGRPPPSTPQLHHLPRALEQRLIRVDVAQRDLSKKPLGGGSVPLIGRAEPGHVESAVRERPALPRDLLEQRPGSRGAVGGPQHQSLEPLRGDVRRTGRKVMQRVGGAPCLQLAQRGLERGSREVRRKLRFADGRARLDRLGVGERVPMRGDPRNGQRREDGESQESDDHRGLGCLPQCGTETGWRPVAKSAWGRPSFRELPWPPTVLPSERMDARTQSALLAAIVCLALALAMLLRQGRTRLWMAFALLNVALLAYQIGDFLYGIFGAAPPWPLRLTLGAAGFIPVAVLGFIVEFQGESAGRVVGLRRFATATALATVAVAVSPLALMPPARVAAAGAVFVQLTAAVSLLYARMRRAASRTERARLFYLWVGAALCVG